ncbi:unnamed protein product [Notodromas monacha]|uniref:Uncharacterized protein n=1 Tax=Notodromas monacha TaxID=399045 RepID=A0A7R9BX19_9CRUS|nr:unnamed protein product [Notodromas monacha]CAG0923370.1 unnamed protein product [Notodromas monacha]
MGPARVPMGTTSDRSEAQRRESDDDTCDEPDEKDALKKDKGVHHHHRHHHHHHHHIKPDSASAVAWMVIAGDGLHNLTDGIAIGSAFAVSYWGGLSTTVAVFCHELPHEVGDFAMLLATGMTVKQALLYNVLSSVLCFAGMAAGIFMVTNSPDGGEATISNWVSAATAGVFIYIALVDMIPELTNSDRGPKNPCLRVTIEVLGMLTGVLIMFVIAFHEDGFYSFLE